MQGSSPHRIKMTMFVVFVLALSVLSFHGALDNFAHENVVRTTTESFALFAISKGIDAAVSLLQSLEFEGRLFVASTSIRLGELLDPINDAVEKLSSVMLWAIGSLAVQRIILEIVSSSLFKWSFFGIGLIAITTWLLGSWQRLRDVFGAWDGLVDQFVRLFVYIAVFRFIVPVFAIISFLVGHLLFDAEINRSREHLTSFGSEVSVDTSTPSPGSQEFEEQETLKVSELDELRDRMNSYIQRAQALDAQIEELRAGTGWRRYLPQSPGGVSPDEHPRPSGSPELDELRQGMAAYVQEAEALDARIEELRAGTGWRRYLPPSLGGASPEERQAPKAPELPELDELRQGMATYVQEAEALDARIEELRAGTGWRRYLPESLGGASPEERQALKASELPELNELRQRMATYVQEAEALGAQIEELRDEGGLRRYLSEAFGSVSPDEELASAKARLKEIRREMEIVENQIHDIEREELASAKARRREIRREMGAVENQMRDTAREELASARARREEIGRKMETLGNQIGVIEKELLASAEAGREEVGGEIEAVESEIRAVEEELECFEVRRTGEDCVSLLGKLSVMGQEGYARIRDLIGKAGDVVTTIVKLMVAVVVKNILLPIAFLMIAVKYALPVARYWARLTSDFRRDVGDFRNTLLPDTGSPRLKEKSEGA